MQAQKDSIIVDAGNTRIKVGVFQDYDLHLVRSFNNDEFNALKAFLIRYENFSGIICSVRSQKDTKWLRGMLPRTTLFTNDTPIPIQNSYDTPKTLGLDRLANAIAGDFYAKSAALVIDIGTCVKYDFVSKDHTYEGGAISPGIQLRYKSMHQFTSKLPLIEDRLQAPVIGKNTGDALRSGVMNGIHQEIVGFMTEYQSLFPELTIFLTGGDASHFEFEKKYSIFADENLTLKGLLITHLHA